MIFTKKNNLLNRCGPVTNLLFSHGKIGYRPDDGDSQYDQEPDYFVVARKLAPQDAYRRDKPQNKMEYHQQNNKFRQTNPNHTILLSPEQIGVTS